MYKVFIENRIVIFTKKFEPEFSTNHKIVSGTIDFSVIIHEIEDVKIGEIMYIICRDVQQTFDEVFYSFQFVEAAGGLVRHENNYLFIFRNNCWDIPKGIIDKGETIEFAAIREVKEECGISEVQIIKPLINTFHTYQFQNQRVRKKTHWLEMSVQQITTLKPQIEEGITEVKWISNKEMKQVFENTYPSIIEVLNAIGLYE